MCWWMCGSVFFLARERKLNMFWANKSAASYTHSSYNFMENHFRAHLMAQEIFDTKWYYAFDSLQVISCVDGWQVYCSYMFTMCTVYCTCRDPTLTHSHTHLTNFYTVIGQIWYTVNTHDKKQRQNTAKKIE